MKIIYYSPPFFCDCDFPLIREMQNKGYDVFYYIPMASFSLKNSLLNISKLYPKTGVFPVSVYPEFDKYKDEIDLSKCFVVNQKYKQRFHPLNLLLYLKLAFHFWRQKPDIIHFVLQPALTMKFIYLLARNKLVMTVHDPILHSSRFNKRDENDRKEAFRFIPKLILLNTKQIEEFRNKYKVPSSHIFISRLGMYDSITRVKSVNPCPDIKKPFILFFGMITAYKGVEFLMEAIVKIHRYHPEVNLVIAGGGSFYFDLKPYENLDYIKIINRYIPIEELAGLLKNCLFSVCPYKDATQSGVVQTAFSLNVPMIVTNVGALPDSVDDGITGLIVPPKDVDALSVAIKKLLDSPQLLDSMRSNIDKIWKPKMAWSAIAESYINCYEK